MSLLTNYSASEIDVNSASPNSMVLAKCPLLIPLVAFRESLIHHLKADKTRLSITWPAALAPMKVKLSGYLEEKDDFIVVKNTGDNDQLGRMLDLVFIMITRAMPVLGQSDYDLANVATKLGMIYFKQSDDGSESKSLWLVCGCTRETVHSLSTKTGNALIPECLHVDGDLVHDEGIAYANFETVIKLFSLDRWSLSQLDDKYKVSASLNEKNELSVYLTMGQSSSSNIGDQFGVNVASHMLNYHNDTHAVVAGVPAGITIVGSLVQQVLSHYPGLVIWGIGLIMPVGPKLGEGDHKVLGVRGPRTRDWLLMKHGLNPLVLSDPAITASDIFPVEVLKNSTEYEVQEVCFVIHSVDRESVFSQCPLCEKHLVNNYAKDIKAFFAALVGCKRVVSSSLHGVIFSNSFDIPALPVAFGDKITGGDFKFMDYMHSNGVTSFQRRLPGKGLLSKNLTVDEWSALVDEAIHPDFPLDKTRLYRTFPSLDKVADSLN